MLNNQIGNKIMELRKKNNLTQEQLAEKLDVTRQTISNWELGESNPDLRQSKELSKIFNISLDELVDNNIKDIVVEKVSNTEKLAGMILRILKICIIVIPLLILTVFALLFIIRVSQNSKDTGREIEETIHCELYGEEHTYGITYQEYTGVIIGEGGDSYFDDILGLGKYDDAHQIFNVINDYVKKNGGTCSMIENKDLNDLVNIEVTSVSNKEVKIKITENEDYNISYGEEFYLEKYNKKYNRFEKMDLSGDDCGFNMMAYEVTPEKPLELTQNFECLYGKLPKGRYNLVKNVTFDSDIPVDEFDNYYVSTEFEIE